MFIFFKRQLPPLNLNKLIFICLYAKSYIWPIFPLWNTYIQMFYSFIHVFQMLKVWFRSKTNKATFVASKRRVFCDILFINNPPYVIFIFRTSCIIAIFFRFQEYEIQQRKCSKLRFCMQIMSNSSLWNLSNEETDCPSSDKREDVGNNEADSPTLELIVHHFVNNFQLCICEIRHFFSLVLVIGIKI